MWASPNDPGKAGFFLKKHMKFILGKKVGMSQMFSDNGTVTPVTVISVEPNVVVQVKTPEKDGYAAVQVGTNKAKNVSKALKGHFKELGSFKHLQEFKTVMVNEKELQRGDTFDVTVFEPGDMVKVAGISKGKGFAGVVKRHGFAGMPASHGHKHVMRHAGSIGQRFPQHTLKGTRMAGRMGGQRVTVRGLKIMAVDPEHQLLAVKGAVPGNRGQLLQIISIK